jgi:hypothetical protein
MSISELLFQIAEDTKKRRENTSKALRDARSAGDGKVVTEKRIYITLPKIEDHSFHLTGKVSNCLACIVHLYNVYIIHNHTDCQINF